jgi:DNA-binding transcriptional regulator YhcF (GntR family)
VPVDVAADDRLVAFIAGYTTTHGFGPSNREMATHLGVTVGALHKRLARLRGLGRVTWHDGLQRTVRVVTDG